MRHTGEHRMKYVLLAYRDEQQWQTMSTSERDAFVNACQVREQELQQNGHLFAAAGQQNWNTTLTVQLLNGKVALTDGPGAATKGDLIQLYFITARDLNEAIQLAAKMPQARQGSVEVRSIIEINYSIYD